MFKKWCSAFALFMLVAFGLFFALGGALYIGPGGIFVGDYVTAAYGFVSFVLGAALLSLVVVWGLNADD